jgi:uncharacterized protein
VCARAEGLEPARSNGIANVGDQDVSRAVDIPRFPGEPNFPIIDNDYWRTINAIWPDLINEQVFIAPPRNGMNRYTGQLIQGWDHVQQSMTIIFQTPYHERVLRRWVGSFVPMILGESILPRILTRFFWAIATALDLWEPGYRFNRVEFMGDAMQTWSVANPVIGATTFSASELIRLGQAVFRYDGQWIPRGHLGNFTPATRKSSTLIGTGTTMWDVQATMATST